MEPLFCFQKCAKLVSLVLYAVAVSSIKAPATCTSKFRKSPETQNSNLAVVHFYNFQQHWLELIFENLSKMRDYHQHTSDSHFSNSLRDLKKYAPLLTIIKLITDHVNLTIISDHCAGERNISTQKMAHLYPAVNENNGSPYKLETIWNHHSKHNNSNIDILWSSYADFNFVYCNVPKLKREPFWETSYLTHAFHPYVWLGTLISLSITIIIIQFSTFIKKMPHVNHNYFGNIFFTLISTLLPNPLMKISKVLRNHKLLIIWMYCSLVLSNCYIAIITSVMIHPPKEISLSEISHLETHNYTLIFRNIYDMRIVKAAVEGYSGDERNDVMILKRMLVKAAINYETNDRTFGEILASGKNVAAVYIWHHVLTFLTNANSAMDSDPRKMVRHCYIGQKLIPSGNLFQVFSSPTACSQSERLRNVAELLRESGIYTFWYTEMYKLQFAERVQDRVKVKGPTKIVYDFEHLEPSPLQMNGRIKSVFFVWLIGILSCLVCIVVEMLLNFN